MVDPVFANITIERIEMNYVDLVASGSQRLWEVVGSPDAGEIGSRVGIH